MPITLNEKFLAYLALFSGIFLSLVAEYYSILGLTAIFSAAVIPVVIMGIALGLGKISATLWLKQNWNIAPWTIRGYLFTAIAILMIITSMGIFGFLSKAHSDQNLVSGDVQSRIAIYDEKIKTAKENIESNRKQLKQMDEAVDQVMARSQDEKGADKANAIRKSQSRDRVALAKDIEANQKLVIQLNDEAAPIRAEVRKVEAEVGPIKYIAAFVYGDTDQTVLEKAVTWVIIILIVVFDPMAVILLLSSQISFQNFREREKPFVEWTERDFEELARDAWLADVGETLTEDKLAEDAVNTATITTSTVNYTILEDADEEYDFAYKESVPHHPDTHPYLQQGFKYPDDYEKVGPMVARAEKIEQPASDLKPELTLPELVEKFGYSSEGGVVKVAGFDYTRDEFDRLMNSGYVQNEEQKESGTWNKVITEQEYREHVEQLNNANKDNTSNSA